MRFITLIGFATAVSGLRVDAPTGDIIFEPSRMGSSRTQRAFMTGIRRIGFDIMQDYILSDEFRQHGDFLLHRHDYANFYPGLTPEMKEIVKRYLRLTIAQYSANIDAIPSHWSVEKIEVENKFAEYKRKLEEVIGEPLG